MNIPIPDFSVHEATRVLFENQDLLLQNINRIEEDYAKRYSGVRRKITKADVKDFIRNTAALVCASSLAVKNAARSGKVTRQSYREALEGIADGVPFKNPDSFTSELVYSILESSDYYTLEEGKVAAKDFSKIKRNAKRLILQGKDFLRMREAARIIIDHLALQPI